MSEKHLYAALRYIERNPIKAGMVKKAEEYHWSSARAHIHKTKDTLLSDNFMIEEVTDWREYLAFDSDEENIMEMMRRTETGRPLGNADFINKIEQLAGRLLQKKKPGPKSAIK